MPPYSASPQLGSYANNASDEARGGFPFPFSQTPTITEQPLPPDTAGTFTTLAAMARCVRGEVPPDFCGYLNPWIAEFANRLIDGAALDCRAEIERVFNYVAKQIRYVPHPVDQQVVQDACRTLQFRTGDCVSKSVLLATLLASLSYPVRFVAQYLNDDQQYSHVYVETQDECGVWFGIDPVADDKPMGWTQKLEAGGYETVYEIF